VYRRNLACSGKSIFGGRSGSQGGNQKVIALNEVRVGGCGFAAVQREEGREGSNFGATISMLASFAPSKKKPCREQQQKVWKSVSLSSSNRGKQQLEA
jgi:hypothetical protein